jgi:hypothetical protein
LRQNSNYLTATPTGPFDLQLPATGGAVGSW